MEKTANSVAEALSRAHETLVNDLKKLGDAVAPAAKESLDGLRARLAAARADIAQHFRFEEENGYLDIVNKREPRLERAIQHLVEEHRELTRALDGVLAAAAAATRVNNTLRRRVREWLAQVRRHEQRENQLVQDAFDFDIGAED
jgi:ElaB/YqjD/DUF883 family membrane-anchored ribosome-binding protein